MNDQEQKNVLLLFLGLEGMRRPPPGSWDFLTVHDLLAISLLSKTIRQQLKLVEYTSCRDGRDYLVPFPGFPGVLGTPSDIQNGAGLFPHQLASLQKMRLAENKDCRYNALRGGILGDAPGLGKTITLLALCASTAGHRPVLPPDFWDKQQLEEGWQILRGNPAFRQDILATLAPIRKWVKRRLHPTSRAYQIFHETQSRAEPPYSDDRFPTLRDFEQYVRRTLRFVVPGGVLENFRQAIVDLQAKLDKRHRKFLMSSLGRRLSWERKLLSCSATLIVVPDALLEHWYQQIDQHVNLKVFVEGLNLGNELEDGDFSGIVYLDGIGDLAEVRLSRKPLRSLSMQRPLLPAWELSKYWIVITTFSRCRSEFDREVASGRLDGLDVGKGKSRGGRGVKRLFQADTTEAPPSALLSLRWLRLVVDEGHELGFHETETAVTRFINLLAAERRWVLSGTPTVGDEDDVMFAGRSLDQLQRLLFFLRHPKYGMMPDAESSQVVAPRLSYKLQAKDASIGNEGLERAVLARSAWDVDVKQPFLNREQNGYDKLCCILHEVMVMHKKEDIKLPPPIFEQAEVNIDVPMMIQEEFRQKLMHGISHATLFLDEYLHGESFQTLVDKGQANYIVKTVQQARRELRHRASTSTHSSDIRPVKSVVYSSKKNILLSVTEQIIREVGLSCVAEMYESPDIGEISAELARFRHGSRECKICPICQAENDVRVTNQHCSNSLIEVAVLQSSHHQEGRYLVEPNRILRPLDVDASRMEGEPLSSYNQNRKFWRVGDMIEVDLRPNNPLFPARESEATWMGWGAERCMELAAQDGFRGPDWYFGPLPDAGDTSLAIAKIVKWQACSRFHGPRWFLGPQLKHQPIQRVEEDVFLLALDAGLSHGLDLSFVTHMFLLEPIEDAALLEQVTSRAHRLGAQGSVRITTVNTFFETSAETQQAITTALSATTVHPPQPDSTLEMLQHTDDERKQILTKAVCHFCYREFRTIDDAEHHERTNCVRNPLVAVDRELDRFHISAAYRAVRPPRALSGDTKDEKGK